MPALTRKMVLSSRSISLSLFFRLSLFCRCFLRWGVLHRRFFRLLHRLWGGSRLWGRWFVLDRDALGIGPEPFERIMFPDIFPENMDDDVAKIHQDPLRRPR